MTESQMPPLTDRSPDNWVERFVPLALRPYARLMRLDRPTGIWLLLLPCLWSVAMAGTSFATVGWMILFFLGAVVMRSAGCIVNDILDRHFDRQVARTRDRPLASGELHVWQALALLALLLVIGFGILCLFNRLTIALGVMSLFLVGLYPLAKRVTWWPQLMLGLTFNWGALMGWTAVTGSIGFPALLLYVAGLCWTLGYDTIYAHQDKTDDAQAGVKSLALKFGGSSRTWVAGFYLATLILLLLAGLAYGFGAAYAVALLAAVFHFGWQVLGWTMDDPDDCALRFRSNGLFGLIVLGAIIIGKLA